MEEKSGKNTPVTSRKILSEILPHLFVGSADDISEENLLENGIELVINATTQYEKPTFLLEENYLKIPVLDTETESLIDFFDTCFSFIDKARVENRRVIVHCQAGKSRSATIAIAYIMRHKKQSMDEAHFFVRSKRHQIDPNFAFLGQLLDYENILSGKLPEEENKKAEEQKFEKRRIFAPKVGTLKDLNVSRKRNRPPPGSLVIGDSRKRRSKNSEEFSVTPKRPRNLMLPKPAAALLNIPNMTKSFQQPKKGGSLPSTPKSPLSKCPFPSRKIHSDSDTGAKTLVRIRHSSAGEFNESE